MSDSPYIFDVTQENFNEVIVANSQRVAVLVDFWADWCAPCRQLTPVLTKVVEDYQGQVLLAKINADEQQAIAAQFGVRSLPTVKLIKDGAIVDEFMGAQPESAIRQMLDKHVTAPQPELSPKEQALQLLAAGDTQTAITLLEQAIAADPGDMTLKVALAKAAMLNGEPERAEVILGDLDEAARELPETQALLMQLQFARIASEGPDRHVLEQRIEADPKDLQARYQLSALNIVNNEFEAALDQLLAIMQRDRSFEDDGGRKGMLAVFDMLGGSGELVSDYRTRLANALH